MTRTPNLLAIGVMRPLGVRPVVKVTERPLIADDSLLGPAVCPLPTICEDKQDRTTILEMNLEPHGFFG